VRGALDRALQEVEAALQRHPFHEMEPPDRPYLNVARFYAEAGSPGRARELIAEHEVAVDPTLQRAREHVRHLALGRVALAESRPLDAIEEIQSYIQRTGNPISGLTTLGRAYEMAGEPDSAIAVYERYVTTPFYERMISDNLWLAFTYERLGQLYEQRGETAKAIYYYGKLVDLWKDADPELQPRVEAARRAIEALSPDT
ncbi:MAG: tetratricopeptide repeat protein, partial [Gemmatimonadota bacterium]